MGIEIAGELRQIPVMIGLNVAFATRGSRVQIPSSPPKNLKPNQDDMLG
jgi:hypothetical protein